MQTFLFQRPAAPLSRLNSPASALREIVRFRVYKGFPKLGVPLWGPSNKGYGTWGSILGPPILGNYHVRVLGLRGHVRVISKLYQGYPIGLYNGHIRIYHTEGF